MKSFVFRSLSIIILLGMLFTSGCGFPLRPSPTVTPTPTNTATPMPSPTATATRRPSPTPLSPFYLEEFQGDMEGWDYFLVTNEKNARDNVDIYPSEGVYG